MVEETKQKVFRVLEEAYPEDLAIVEVAKRTGLARMTASMWLKVLEAEGKIETSRRIGPAVFYRLKK